MYKRQENQINEIRITDEVVKNTKVVTVGTTFVQKKERNGLDDPPRILLSVVHISVMIRYNQMWLCNFIDPHQLLPGSVPTIWKR